MLEKVALLVVALLVFLPAGIIIGGIMWLMALDVLGWIL